MFIIKFSLTVYPFNNPKYNGVTSFLVHVGKLVHEIYIMGILIDGVIFVCFFLNLMRCFFFQKYSIMIVNDIMIVSSWYNIIVKQKLIKYPW